LVAVGLLVPWFSRRDIRCFANRSLAANPLVFAPVKRLHMIAGRLVVLLFCVGAVAALKHFPPF